MSGGHYNYMYCRIEDEYVDRMYDSQLNEMMKDLCKLLHDLEWWKSCLNKLRLMYKSKSNQSLSKQKMSC